MSFIGGLGMRKWFEHGVAYGDLPIEPWMRGPGGGLRIGLGAILTDLVIGIPAAGRTASTVELSVRWTAGAPVVGPVTSNGRILKWGERLMFGDSSLTDGTGGVIGWAVGTFVTGEVGAASDLTTTPRQWGGLCEPHVSVEAALQVEVVGPGVVVMPVRPELMNWPGGSVQGGIQACLAELAAERALPGPCEITDLAIRYVNRIRIGPARAVATALPGPGTERTVRVDVLDAGDGDRLVSHVLAVACPIDPP